MTIDLSGLDEGFSRLLRAEVAESNRYPGIPLELPLSEILEDEEQPRTTFDQAALDELASSIRADKVRVPISVRSRNVDGKYLINHGARRYRASLIAGKTTIPAFIDDDHDDYAQVVENIQRDHLTPLDIARFIQRRRAAGDMDKVIAERLGKGKPYISVHAALLSWPKCIESLYEAGHCTDVSTLYNLIQLYKRAPSAVEGFCQRDQAVTRRDVSELGQRMADGKAAISENPPASQPSAPSHASSPNQPVQSVAEALSSPSAAEADLLREFAAGEGAIEIRRDLNDAAILKTIKFALSMARGKPFKVVPIE